MRRACWGNTQWGCRKILSHIKHLPRDSAFARARNGDAAEWTQGVEIGASIFDAVQALTRIYINANSEQKITEPLDHYPRPGHVKAEPENTVTLSGFAGLLKEKI